MSVSVNNLCKRVDRDWAKQVQGERAYPLDIVKIQGTIRMSRWSPGIMVLLVRGVRGLIRMFRIRKAVSISIRLWGLPQLELTTEMWSLSASQRTVFPHGVCRHMSRLNKRDSTIYLHRDILRVSWDLLRVNQMKLATLRQEVF
jgi:hypothetical protein